MSVNVHEAKTNLSKLLARVEAGEEIVIARAGKPVAKLIPAMGGSEPRKPGRWAGKVSVPDDFDAPLPHEVQRYFDGESDPEDGLD